MKSVILVRHAKSSWDAPGIPDIDRPLNDRGKHDCPMMAKRLLEKKVTIDAFLSSPARRAKKTATLFAEEYKIEKDKLILIPELYQAEPQTFYAVIAQAPSHADHIALFSHNPGITEFANMLTAMKVDDMPTCAVFAVQADIKSWHEFQNAHKEFCFFDYPKSLTM